MRQRLLCRGAEGLADAELLAICLGAGQARGAVLDLAMSLLAEFGGLGALLATSPGQLLSRPGLGLARTARLKACQVLEARGNEQLLSRQGVFLSSASVLGFLRAHLARRDREIFAALFMDTRNRLISYEELFLGSIDRANVHPRELLKRALGLNAAAVVLAHNHPSGIAEPSASDLQLTAELRDLLIRVDVRLLDHVIVTPGRQVSLADRGML